MPYIKQEDRQKLDAEIDTLINRISTNFPEEKSGILNYVITRLLVNTLHLHDNTRYHNINCAAGVLECVKLEMYRRIAARYEGSKIVENTDVREYQDFDYMHGIK
jgi:hypothetical protein